MGLLLVYGLNTWLPQIMRSAGYNLGAALALLLVLNVGAVVGLLAAGRVADRLATGARRCSGSRRSDLPGADEHQTARHRHLRQRVLAGVFVFSGQVLVYAYISHVYPTAARGTASVRQRGGRIGAIAGPLMGGALLTAASRTRGASTSSRSWP